MVKAEVAVADLQQLTRGDRFAHGLSAALCDDEETVL
jgi:hypothetical protein